MTTYYLLATSGIFAVLFFIALWKLFQRDEYHEIQKEYIAVCEERIKIGDELEEMRVDQVAHYESHIRNQDAVMAQLTLENKILNISIKGCESANRNYEKLNKDLENANSIQAKAYQSLLNNNNKLHRELKLARNPKPTSGLDLNYLEANLDKALERDFPSPDEYYDTITEINNGDVFLCVEDYGLMGAFNFYANREYASEINQFITSHDGSPVRWCSESWQININKHFKKLKPKK